MMIFDDDFISFITGPFGIFAMVALFMLYSQVSGLMSVLGRRRNRTRSERENRISLWNIALLIMFFALPFIGGFGFLLLFIMILIIRFMSSSDEGRFLKYQEILPTSKIRSMATGLVELQGSLHVQKQVKAPLSRQRCIGYYHTVHEELRNSDGERYYRLIHEKRHCEPFILQDATGKVQVDGEQLKFHLLPVAKEQYSANSVAREYLLQPGGNYLLIGQVVRRKGEMVVIRDHYRRVFGIAPFGHLKRKRKLNGLLRTFTVYSVVIALMVALFLTLPVGIKGQQLLIYYTDWSPFTVFHTPLLEITQ
ncbi:TPA: hypothetical protein I8Y21_003631 [Klebsiella oxytoca]|uniref:RING-type E3 ubiquitin transferase n=1 Tax=Klebsiella oxytoca TaxID=571 RepID=A0AAN5REP4_KLEOX|nr:hypothetical protein [Klebsiella oxytoca]